MEVVFKYKLKFRDIAQVEMPLGAKILTIDKQADSLENLNIDSYVCIWAVVDNEVKEMETRKFRIAGTGHSLDNLHLKYINSVQVFNGSQIYHIFEILQ